MSIQSRALESRARVTGPTLLHGDLYPFNLLLTQDRVVVNDWPPAWIGAPFCDVVSLLSGARLSGIDPQPIAESHPLTRGLMPGQIDEFLALHSGFLLRAAASTGLMPTRTFAACGTSKTSAPPMARCSTGAALFRPSC